MASWNPLTLSRDCEATTIPYGERVQLAAGGEVQIVQQLGASITVRTEMGALLRIDGADADTLGLDPIGAGTATGDTGSFSMERVMDALQTVYDPEIPVSIVELGLVYRCEELQRDDGSRLIEVDMSMTAPGCGMGDVLRADVERALAAIPGVDAVEVALVWEPRWTVQRMSEAARLQLGML